ncbi:DUF7146 domain-containing protein [Nitrobacteraceae bacterium UC4446_H13]
MTINLRTRQGWDDLKHRLDDRPEDVLAMCRIKLPEAALRNGTVAVIDDPRGGGHGNFAIWCKRDGLSWKNYSTDDRGRSLELIAYCKGWYHLDKRGAAEAARFAIERLGLAHVSEEDLARDRANAAEAKAKHAEQAETSAREGRAWAFRFFTKDAQPILGSIADTGYLRGSRGVDMSAAPFLGPRGGNIAPHALRFLPRHKYVRRNRAGAACGHSFHPCMVAACVDADMKIAAVHQTWLGRVSGDVWDKVKLPPAPDGYEQKARKVFPSSRGCVIPLWRGDGHLSVREACEAGLLQTLVLTEGVEDGLSAIVAGPQHRVWAMISLSNMVNVADRLPACVDAVIVHRQNDWDKPSAIAAFDRGMAALRATGRAVAEVEAVYGKDLNDTLREGAGELEEKQDA